MPASLRLIHVLSSFGVGGQERVALDLAASQVRRGHRVTAVSLAGLPHGPLADAFEARGARVAAIAKGPGFDAGLIRRLARLVWREQAEIVHTHNPQPLIYAAPAARLAGARVVHTKHGLNPGSRGSTALRRLAALSVDAFVAVSQTTAEQARAQRDCPVGRLHMIPNGIALEGFGSDPEARRAVRAELGIGADAWVVGTVGRLDENKNQALLVEAVEPLLARGVHLVIVGDGPTAEPLAARVERLPRAQAVHLTGRRMDVPRLLSAFDVFALSSHTEGLPLVVPEAMASSLPVVSTAVGGIPTVIDEGETGFLVPAGDAAAMRARLQALVEDRRRARRMGERARAVALERYSAERMADDYERLYWAALTGS